MQTWEGCPGSFRSYRDREGGAYVRSPKMKGEPKSPVRSVVVDVVQIVLVVVFELFLPLAFLLLLLLVIVRVTVPRPRRETDPAPGRPPSPSAS